MEIKKPECFTPEQNVGYPLCIGQNKPECEGCNLFVDYENEEEY